jgi:hypothetical protein
MTTFPSDVVEAVLHHMNDDHADDSLVIVRAFAETDATAATMAGLDSAGGTWRVEVDDERRSVTIPWLGPVVDRADIRREVVNLHTAAIARLGLSPSVGH